MHSSMIGKIEKAHRYAREPQRIQLDEIGATFHGSHDDYAISLRDGHWHCTCHTFESGAVGDTCSHVMAMQQLLDQMLRDQVRFRSPEPIYAVGD